jgi:ATP-dependent Clp protease, protease subunit
VSVDHHARAALPPDVLLDRHRTILLAEEITEKSTTEVIAKLLYLQHASAAPVALYIDSFGGVVVASLAIRDTIDSLGIAVHTHCLGTAGGAAMLLLAHGARGGRTATAGAQIILVEVPGLATVAEMLAADTGQSVATITRDSAAGRRFDAIQARAYGLIDSSTPDLILHH